MISFLATLACTAVHVASNLIVFMDTQQKKLLAGAAAVDITPRKSLHLAGYPFVKRDSTGVHDKLWSSAFYLKGPADEVLFIGNDVIFISKCLAAKARQRIKEATGVSEKNIIVSATHTHSSPGTINFVAGSHDNLLPPIDDEFLQQLEDGIVAAGIQAIRAVLPARLGYAIADATGIGTNRHDPEGPSDMQVPVLLAVAADTNEVIACMLICNMHPTVLHGDSTLVSGDFPGLARLHLQQYILKSKCPVIYHIGPAGNQSPRYVTRSKTFEEAERIGKILANAVSTAINSIEWLNDVAINVSQNFIDLPHRIMPEVSVAAEYENKCFQKLVDLHTANVAKEIERAAEVNWFGATELLHLAKMAADGSLNNIYNLCLPAEIQLVQIGRINIASWPGEIFVEYGLKLKQAYPDTFAITLSNGDLQVYIATKEAVEAGVYEASNAIFDYTSGDKIVNETILMIKNS